MADISKQVRASGIVVYDLGGRPMPGVSGQPVASSNALAWRGFMLEHHRLPPDVLPSAVSPTHVLGLPLTPTPPDSFTWHVQGQTLHGHMMPNQIYLRAAGEEFACEWKSPLEITFLSVEPQSIAWACDMLGVKGSQMLRTHLARGGGGG